MIPRIKFTQNNQTPKRTSHTHTKKKNICFQTNSHSHLSCVNAVVIYVLDLKKFVNWVRIPFYYRKMPPIDSIEFCIVNIITLCRSVCVLFISPLPPLLLFRSLSVAGCVLFPFFSTTSFIVSFITIHTVSNVFCIRFCWFLECFFSPSLALIFY